MSPTAEYEVFQYKHFDEPVLSLAEATEKAERLRRYDPKKVYRVVPVDIEMTGFTVEKLSLEKVYGDVWARVFRHIFRYMDGL